MKNKAFTLAEVLITLGIIGVIAALTMPTMVNNGAKAKIGPELASVVSTLSEGIRLFMNTNNADYVSVAMKRAEGVSDTKLETLLTTLTDKGSEFYCIKATSGGNVGDAKPYSGDGEGGLTSKGSKFTLANKSIIAAETKDCDLANAACGLIFYTSSAASIYSKDSAKLRNGLHVFKLTVTDDGEVKGAVVGDCDKDGMKAATSVGSGCAAEIEKNGWKVFY